MRTVPRRSPALAEQAQVLAHPRRVVVPRPAGDEVPADDHLAIDVPPARELAVELALRGAAPPGTRTPNLPWGAVAPARRGSRARARAFARPGQTDAPGFAAANPPRVMRIRWASYRRYSGAPPPVMTMPSSASGSTSPN